LLLPVSETGLLSKTALAGSLLSATCNFTGQHASPIRHTGPRVYQTVDGPYFRRSQARDFRGHQSRASGSRIEPKNARSVRRSVVPRTRGTYDNLGSVD
jgi:hypothetical protein